MYLISLDQQTGDGDLGISMDNGFKAVSDVCCVNANTSDIGKLLFLAGKSFNEAAPSSLGTIISMLLIDAAKQLKGAEKTTLADFGNIMHKSMNAIMEKLDSRLGEKTFFDSVVPAVKALCDEAAVSDEQRLKMQQRLPVTERKAPEIWWQNTDVLPTLERRLLAALTAAQKPDV